MNTFQHPLARHAKVWPTAGLNGKAQKVLLVVTTLELDSESKRHKADKVAALCDAAKSWIAANPTEAVDFLLTSRQKEWDDGRK